MGKDAISLIRICPHPDCNVGAYYQNEHGDWFLRVLLDSPIGRVRLEARSHDGNTQKQIYTHEQPPIPRLSN